MKPSANGTSDTSIGTIEITDMDDTASSEYTNLIKESKHEDVARSEERIEEKSLNGLDRVYGLLLMVASAVSFSLMSLVVHMLSSIYFIPAYELVFFRGMFGVMVCFSYLLYSSSRPRDDGNKNANRWERVFGPPGSRRLLVLRAFIGVCGYVIISLFCFDFVDDASYMYMQ